MDCPSARGEIPALIQGELAEDAHRTLEDHLRACPGCAAEERDLRAVLQALRDASESLPGPSPAVWEAIAREAAAPGAPPPPAVPAPSRPPFRLRVLRDVAAIAAVFLAAAALLVLRPPPGARPAPVASVTPAAGAIVTVDGKALDRADTLIEAGPSLRVEGAAGAVLVTPASARLVAAPGTELRFASPRELSLARGALLVEEGDPPLLAVSTPAARIVPLGTRFLVVHDGTTTVTVDEGVVRVTAGAVSVDVAAGHAASAGPGGPPAPPVAAPDAAARLQRHQDAAAPAGLRLVARLEPPAPAAPAGRVRLSIRIEKVPGVGLPETQVSTIAGGLAYLTCAGESAAAPGPVIPIEAPRLTERGDIRQGVARIAAATPLEIAGEMDLGALLPKGGGAARVVVTWVGRRPPNEPRAWAGELVSGPISVPGAAGGR